ncbi:MAG: phosphoribosyl-AMP cyclohydrolase [Candidatus Nanopelagicales bacterium]
MNSSEPEPMEMIEPVFGADGLIPVIAQDAATGRVLMMAWMDAEALRRTQRTGQATYWSRSRQEYWVKGATSGHAQQVREISIDCDGDVLLLSVDQLGPACHTGSVSCFEGRVPAGMSDASAAGRSNPA